MKKRLFVLLFLALAVTGTVFATQAETDVTAQRNQISASLAQTPLDFSDGKVPVCPYCGTAPASWQELSACTGTTYLEGHYYLSKDIDYTANTHYYNVSATACIYLNGQDVESTKRVFLVSGTLTIMGTADSTVTGTDAANDTGRGDALDVNGGTVNICGGTYLHESGNDPIVLMRGASSVVNVYDGTIIRGNSNYANPSIEITANSCQLNLYGGTVTDGYNTSNGGNIYASGTNVQINISGNAKLLNGTANSGGNISATGGVTINISNNATISGGIVNGTRGRGGNLFIGAGCTLNISGGTVSNGSASVTAEGNGYGNGGNIYNNGGTVTITGGQILDGTAQYYGGNIYMGDSSRATMSAGLISGGTASSGGNICLQVYGTSTGDAYKSVFDFNGGTITGGTATTTVDYGGGNVFLFGNADNTSTLPTFNMSAGTLGGMPEQAGGNTGYAEFGGGNIYVSRGALTVTGGEISGGKAFNNGGNMYISGTASRINISDCTIDSGRSEYYGGNIYIASRGTPVTITDTAITNGSSLSDGGNIYANNGKLTLTGCTITGGRGNSGGNLVIGSSGTSDKTTIGDCDISGGTATVFGNDIYLSEDGKLALKSTFKGTSRIYVAAVHMPESIVGGYLNASLDTCEGPFPGQLLLENVDGAPSLYGVKGDTKLYIASAALVSDDGTKTWYADNAAAMDAYTGSISYIQAGPGELALTGANYIVDLAGNEVSITGSGNVTCFDSANDNYKSFGSATVTGPVLKNEFATEVNGSTYCTIQDETGAYSFHRLNMNVTAVSLRTGTAGIYYWADWDCDSTLAAMIDTYGIACRLNATPTQESLLGSMEAVAAGRNGDTLYSLVTNSTEGDAIFANTKHGDEITGATMNSILSEQARTMNGQTLTNDTAGRMPIYAAPYVVFRNGDTLVKEEAVNYSLYDIVSSIDAHIESYTSVLDIIRNFSDHWKNYGVDWGFSFEVSEDIIHLNALYEGRTPYYGELHDHSDSGGTSDGHHPIEVWAEQIEPNGLDYAAVLDHKQVLHMYLDVWDDSIFVGGTEAATSITDRDSKYNAFHYNMIFSTPQPLEQILNAFPEFEFQLYTEGEYAGQWHFTYPSFTSDRFNELITAVKDAGGFFVIPHPSDTEDQYTEDALAYWFQDETGFEVIYGWNSTTTDNRITEANYMLWTKLLAAGKRVWATSGNDDHELPSTKCLSTIYSTAGNAQAHIDQLRVGDFTAGPVGIRMCVGDTAMGGQGDFTDQRLVFCVENFHESALIDGHTYRVDLLDDQGVIYSQEITGEEPLYYAMDADSSAQLYRVEVYDVTEDKLLALGNPIWNLD